jgi:CRP-like cAMP-binding protein
VPRVTATMQKLQELRAALLIDINQRERELEALRNRLKGFEAAMSAMSGTNVPPDPRRRTRRNVKGTVMDLIVEAGMDGVTAHEIVDKAAAAGRQLDRPSVSSLLSRLKREGVLSFDGERYYQAAGREIENSPSLKIVGAS